MADDQGAVTSDHPERILSSAAAIENLVTWIVAGRVSGDQFGFHLFMSYAADRIRVDEKVKMLGEVIDAIPGDESVSYPGFLDDLRYINRTRVQVAHAINFEHGGPGDEEPAYVMFRNGEPRRVPVDEMRQQVDEAAKRVGKALAVLIRVADATGTMKLPVLRQPGDG